MPKKSISTGGPATVTIPVDRKKQTANIRGNKLQIFTYRPDSRDPSGLLLVFHGRDRNAADYRDHAMPLADKCSLVVGAPLFAQQPFPDWAYQRGGITRRGCLIPANDRTVALVPHLIAWVREREGRPDLPVSLIGHSAGAQFLSRVSAYQTVNVRHIVIANPSSWVMPSLDEGAPFGFGGVFPPEEASDALRRYLASPITVLLGENDTGSKHLANSAAAKKQGASRLARGLRAYDTAHEVARVYGWPCNWRLAKVPDVGHCAEKMFTSDQATAALQS